jgi:hypothetical protein
LNCTEKQSLLLPIHQLLLRFWLLPWHFPWFHSNDWSPFPCIHDHFINEWAVVHTYRSTMFCELNVQLLLARLDSLGDYCQGSYGTASSFLHILWAYSMRTTCDNTQKRYA